MFKLEDEFVHLARLALAQKNEDVQALVRRAAHKLTSSKPELASQLQGLIASAPAAGSLRGVAANPIPVDSDSRLELLRREWPVVLTTEPIWVDSVASQLEAVLAERLREEELLAADLTPTRSILFTGPPGVGKTLAARWLAERLGRPLFILDLAAVMSSFLGRTGNNVRTVLDYAQRTRCVLLLDEFDAIAKRRDDATEIGELKRLVTVLLQSIDEWPTDGLLLAATNHPELLDPAVWRRFERVVEFPKPELAQAELAIMRFLGPDGDKHGGWAKPLALAFVGHSFADIELKIRNTRRNAVVHGLDIDQALEELASGYFQAANKKEKIAFAVAISEAVSQRKASKLTGVSRDTIRTRLNAGAHEEGHEG